MGLLPLDIIGAGLNGLSTIANFVSNERNNAANARQNDLNREFQHNENQLGRDFLSDEAEKARLWNSPGNQKQLMLEAGLNPFLNNATLGSAAVAPSSAPSVPSPNSIPMQAFRAPAGFALGLTDLAQVDNLRSQSSDNRASAFEKFVAAIPILAKYLGADAVREMMSEYLPQITHNRYESSQESRMYERQIRRADLDYEMNQFELGLQQKYGNDMTYRKLLNLEQEAAQSVTYVGLMNSLYRLNESNIEVNDAKIEELIKSAYQHFMHGNFMAAKTLTENESRTLFIGSLAQQVLSSAMDLEEQSSEFSENEMVRKYRGTKAAKINRQFDYGLSNNVGTSTLDYILNRANKALGVKGVFKQDSPAVPVWQKVKHKATRPTYSGKESIEWYTDY